MTHGTYNVKLLFWDVEEKIGGIYESANLLITTFKIRIFVQVTPKLSNIRVSSHP